jgi:hypothetical protein
MLLPNPFFSKSFVYGNFTFAHKSFTSAHESFTLAHELFTPAHRRFYIAHDRLDLAHDDVLTAHEVFYIAHVNFCELFKLLEKPHVVFEHQSNVAERDLVNNLRIINFLPAQT